MMTDEEIKKLLNETGLKRTPQRIEIIRYIFEHNHCSAQEIKENVSKKVPSVSFSTIYYTLEKLIDLGKIVPITIEPETVRYDTNLTPHYHIICVECGSITEVPINLFEKFSEEELKSAGFSEIYGFEIHFFGLCKKCSNKMSKK